MGGVRLRSGSGKRFFEIFSSGGGRIAALLVIGALLLILGSLGGEVSEAADETDEERLEAVCSSIDGVGRCRVMVSYGESGEVYAVAVLCDGADAVRVRESIVDLFSSLYGIGANRISILRLEDG